MRRIQEPDEIQPSKVDTVGPVDYEKLKLEIENEGPFTIRYPDWAVDLTINISKCQIENCDCRKDVISVTLASGFTSLSTLITREDLEGSKSIGAFANRFLHWPQRYFGSSAEIQYIEREISAHLGINAMEVYNNGIPDDGLITELSPECKADFWRAHNLRSIFFCLWEHREMLTEVGSIDGKQQLKEAFPTPNDLTKLVRDHYTMGFLTARMISEHFVRYEIEPLAEKGLAGEAAQEKRNAASGRRSSEMRHKRIDEMLSRMEALFAENPAFGRVGLKKLADLAIEDCAQDDPALWKQGKGRRDEYMDEMRSDLRYQARFFELERKTP